MFVNLHENNYYDKKIKYNKFTQEFTHEYDSSDNVSYDFFYKTWCDFYDKIEKFDHTISSNGIPYTVKQGKKMQDNFKIQSDNIKEYLSKYIKSESDELESELARKSANIDIDEKDYK